MVPEAAKVVLLAGVLPVEALLGLVDPEAAKVVALQAAALLVQPRVRLFPTPGRQ